MARLTVADDDVELARLAAERVTELVEDAVREHGDAFVSLTGGSTPRALYSTLAAPNQPWRGRTPWSRVHLFWGDERHVPPDHPESNYGMARATLLDHVPIPGENVHRIRAELPDAVEAAADYERTLDSVVSGFLGPPKPRSGEGGSRTSQKNFFDLMLLGLGEDAHIASIFPGSELLNDFDHSRRVAAVWANHLDAWRITLTPSAILDSRAFVLLVSGARKADAVYAGRKQAADVKAYPVQLLRAADDRVEWFVDRAAASRL